MSNELWGLGAAGITIHFRCCLCGEEFSVRQDFVNALPVIFRPSGPSGWIRINTHWYCGDHSDEDVLDEIGEIHAGKYDARA